MAEVNNAGSADIQKLVKNHSDNTSMLYGLVILLALVSAFYLFLLYGHNRPAKYQFSTSSKNIKSISVNGQNASTIAVLTGDSIFLSSDEGAHFELIAIPSDTVNYCVPGEIYLAPDGKTIALVSHNAADNITIRLCNPKKNWSNTLKFNNLYVEGITFYPDSSLAYMYGEDLSFVHSQLKTNIYQLKWFGDSAMSGPIQVTLPPGFNWIGTDDIVCRKTYDYGQNQNALTAYGYFSGPKNARIGYLTVVNFDSPSPVYYTDSLITRAFAKTQKWDASHLGMRKLFFDNSGLYGFTTVYGDSGGTERCYLFETDFKNASTTRLGSNSFVPSNPWLTLDMYTSLALTWGPGNSIVTFSGGSSYHDTINYADTILDLKGYYYDKFAVIQNNSGHYLARKVMGIWQIVPIYYTLPSPVTWQQKWYLLPVPVIVFLLGFILVLLYNNRQLRAEINQKLQRKPDILELFNDQPLQYEPGHENE